VTSIDKSIVISDISPPLDKTLATQLLDEYISQEKRFILGDWEPATLDGGQFAEAAARILYHHDSGILDKRKGVNECLQYVEDFQNKNKHNFPDRKSAVHLCKALRAIYKFRSDRGAVHIDPDYNANHLDSKYLLESCRWVLSELLRLFWKGDRKEVSSIIKQILKYEIPSIRTFDDNLLVQRTDCSTEEEILILLYYSRDVGLSRTQLGQFVQKAPSAITNAIKFLASSKMRQIYKLKNGNFCLTDIGARRVLSELANKLVLNY
jgi:hypothetical protein